MIKSLLFGYKNKKPVSTTEFNQQIYNEKFRIPTESPLHFACLAGNETTVKYLIHLGADIDSLNNSGYTTFFYACISGNETLIKYLVEQGDIDDINYRSWDGTTALFFAYLTGDTNIIDYLIECGADIEQTNDVKETAFLHVWNCEKKTQIGQWITIGILYDEWYYESESLLKSVLKYMDVQHTDMDVQHTEYGDNTMLHIACEKKYNEYIVDYCIKKMKSASYYENFNAIEYHYPFNINYRNERGETALDIAYKKGNENIINCLIKNGALTSEQVKEWIDNYNITNLGNFEQVSDFCSNIRNRPSDKTTEAMNTIKKGDRCH